MNEKFQYRTRPCDIENFEFIVSERVQVNPDNSRAMNEYVNIFIIVKCQKKCQMFVYSGHALSYTS